VFGSQADLGRIILPARAISDRSYRCDAISPRHRDRRGGQARGTSHGGASHGLWTCRFRRRRCGQREERDRRCDFVAGALNRDSFDGQGTRQPAIVEGCLPQTRGLRRLFSGSRRIVASQRQPRGELRRIRLEGRRLCCREGICGCGKPSLVASIVRDQAAQKRGPRNRVCIIALLNTLRRPIGFDPTAPVR
jgi:hypothetical protein